MMTLISKISGLAAAALRAGIRTQPQRVAVAGLICAAAIQTNGQGYIVPNGVTYLGFGGLGGYRIGDEMVGDQLPDGAPLAHRGSSRSLDHNRDVPLVFTTLMRQKVGFTLIELLVVLAIGTISHTASIC